MISFPRIKIFFDTGETPIIFQFKQHKCDLYKWFVLNVKKMVDHHDFISEPLLSSSFSRIGRGARVDRLGRGSLLKF